MDCAWNGRDIVKQDGIFGNNAARVAQRQRAVLPTLFVRFSAEKLSASSRTRTENPLIKSQML